MKHAHKASLESNEQRSGHGLNNVLGKHLGIAAYFYLAFLSPWTMLTIQLSASIAFAAILLIIAWIGYTLATISPPTPLE